MFIFQCAVYFFSVRLFLFILSRKISLLIVSLPITGSAGDERIAWWGKRINNTTNVSLNPLDCAMDKVLLSHQVWNSSPVLIVSMGWIC